MQARLPLPGRALALALSLIAACLATGCSSTNLNGKGAGDILASGSTVRVTQQLQITPKQLFTGDHLTYSVNSVVGGNAEFGTITSAGLYTAPAVVPTPNTVTITATSAMFPSAAPGSVGHPGLEPHPRPRPGHSFRIHRRRDHH